jgi:hypothetical protein
MNDEKEVQQQLLGKWIAQRDNLNRLIEALQIELGQDPSGNAVVTPSTGHFSISGSATALKIRPDEYFGMSQTEAAYAYLKKIGHAVHLDSMLEALRAGGVKFSGRDPKSTLYAVLIRGTRRFVLVSPGTFGLLEFYPERVKPKEEKGKPSKKKPSGKVATAPKALPASKRERDRYEKQPDPAPAE